MNDTWYQYCIYHNVPDYPEKFVVIKWLVAGPGVTDTPVINPIPVIIANTIEEARSVIPMGHIQSPWQEPEPTIFEVWI